MIEDAKALSRGTERLARVQPRPVEGAALVELPGSGGLSEEEEEGALASEATHDVRGDMRRERGAEGDSLPAPSPEEIAEWEHRREERRRREGYRQTR
jgi:hypothetical protein